MKKNLIFDIGMHNGNDTLHYLKSGFTVLAIEANPLLVENARKKFSKYIGDGRLTILNVGIADKNEILPFYKNLRLSEWSSFDKAIGTRNNTAYETIEVQCVTTESLFEQYGIPFYMKIDIEGFDYLCLQAIPEKGFKPEFVSCEACHFSWLNMMKEKGYSKFKLISQGDNFISIDLRKEVKKYYPTYQIIKNGIKLRLQKFIVFKYPYGSSGPFGNQTKGEWMSFEDVERLYNSFYKSANGKPLNEVSWFDFHAAL